MSRPVVFLGPTLPRAEAEALLPGALVLPPARQGDVFRAVRAHRPGAVGLVDGAFLDVPAVWHRELLWALDRGVRVYGAASMGALRAAELHPFGMTGVGRVFAAYRDGAFPGWDDAFEDDDEVAVIHAPPEAGGAALSDAMVDVRWTLLRAERAGVVGRAARDALAHAMKARHFPDRTLAALRAQADPAPAEWIGAHHVSLKAQDAREMLRAVASDAADAAAGADAGAPPPFRMERALVWERFVAGSEEVDAEEEAVLASLARDPAAWDAVAREALGRIAALGSVPEAAGDGFAAALGRFRRARGLLSRAELDGWMTRNGVPAAELERLVREQARLDATAAETPGLRRAMLDVLRLGGRYEASARGAP